MAVTPEHDHDVDEIERWSPLQAWLYSLFARGVKRHALIVDLLQVGPGARLLDLGCGLGQLVELAGARGAEASGIDPSPSMVRRARRRVPDASIQVGSAEDIPFPDDTFSHVVATATFHHWADREAGLSEALRVLASGGRFLIVEKDLTKGGEHGLSPNDARLLAGRLEELGLKDVEVGELRQGRHRMVSVSGSRP